MRPWRSNTMLRELEVPWSSARMWSRVIVFRLSAAGHAVHPGRAQQLRERRRRRRVGEQHVDLVEARELDHRRPVELAVVGRDPDLARVLDDRTGDLDLAVVEVAQRAVGLYARDADQADVD